MSTERSTALGDENFAKTRTAKRLLRGVGEGRSCEMVWKFFFFCSIYEMCRAQKKK